MGGFCPKRGKGAADVEVAPLQDMHPVVGSTSPFVYSANLLALRKAFLPVLDSLLPASEDTTLFSKGLSQNGGLWDSIASSKMKEGRGSLPPQLRFDFPAHAFS